jgi:hypothetical protein
LNMARLLSVSAVALVAILAFAPRGSARPLVTAVHEPQLRSLPDTEASTGLSRIRAAGSRVVREELNWRFVAPVRPLDPTNPADPLYDWTTSDRFVRLAQGRGLRVSLIINVAPDWAQGPGSGRAGTVAPNPAEFGLFARAAAERYDGDFVPPGATQPLPEVRDWEIWNEPNLPFFFNPQRDAVGNSVAPAAYREMVNAAAASIHAVDPGNNVVAGALAPFGPPEGHMPLDFMRKMLCMSAGPRPRPTCSMRVEFDTWSHHPYTQGGPNHHAYWPDDVSLADLPEMRRLLNAAVAAGHVASSRPVGFWVTEFSWETKGPDKQGVPHRRHARWTAEGLYRMWRSGVSLVTWWLLRDRAFPASYNQSGLYFCGRASLADERTCEGGSLTRDSRKLSFRAFRFPFVALPRGGKVFVWGRTPSGKPGRVVIEARFGSRWRRIATLRSDKDGIFSRTVGASVAGRHVRARLARKRDASVPFQAVRTRDVPLAHPFGCGGPLPC